MFLHCFHACLHDFLILGHKIWFCYSSLLLATVANRKTFHLLSVFCHEMGAPRRSTFSR